MSAENDKAEIYRILMHPGTLKILRVLNSSPTSFSDIMFKSKISPSVLDRLLKSLLSSDIVCKESDKNYALTQKGKEILRILENLCETL